MPALLLHEGVWIGEYRHLDAAGELIDRHESRVSCEFPDTGEFAYVQHNTFTWADGQRQSATLPGRLENDRLTWDTDRFSGFAWQTDEDVIMLRLERKDEPGVHFVEAIILPDREAAERARTWHWFKAGRLIRRTLCHERRQA